MIIDAHTHVGSDIYAGDKTGRSDLAAAHRYVQILDANGVDQGFAFMLSGLYTDPQAGNDDLARARDAYPDRIIPWGTVDPYWDEKKIRRELRRCITSLGFSGIKFHPWIQGFTFTDTGMEIVAEECIDMNAPITTHDGTPFNCTALQVVYYARTHPELTVVSGHAGLREGWRDIIAPAKELPNYWMCVCGPTQQGIQTLYDELGPDRLLFGSDGGAFHPATTADYLRRIRALRAPAGDIDKILGGNAERLLKRR